MAFKASNLIPHQAYTSIKADANKMRTTMLARTTEFASDASFERIWQTRQYLRSTAARMDVLAATPGLVAYAKEQEGDPTYDVAAEYTAMKAAMVSAADWIDAALPADGDGYVLVHKVGANDLDPRVFTSAQLSVLVTRLQSVAATVI